MTRAAEPRAEDAAAVGSGGVALVVVGLLAALAAAAAGLVLTEVYWPSGSGAAAQALPDEAQRSGWWTSAQSGALGVQLVAGLAALVAVTVRTRRADVRPPEAVAVVGGSSAGALGAVLALATRSLVAWDDLRIHAVAELPDLRGYRYAATGDVVRFLVVGGAEVSQGRYAAALAVHLLVLVAGAVALAWAAWRLRPRRA